MTAPDPIDNKDFQRLQAEKKKHLKPAAQELVEHVWPQDKEIDEILWAVYDRGHNSGLDAEIQDDQPTIDIAKAKLEALLRRVEVAGAEKFAALLIEGSKNTGSVNVEEGLKIFKELEGEV